MPTDFGILLEPRSIAIAGAGSNPHSLGARTLRMIDRFGFRGDLYALNPNSRDCGRFRGYAGIAELPTTPDLCIVAVPPDAAIDVVGSCASRRVPFAHVLTSGPNGSSDFDRELAGAAAGRTRLIGPNCVGTHSPSGRISFIEGADSTVGTISIVSQSGGLSLDFVNQLPHRASSFRAVISAGNCADVSLAELVEFFATDDATTVIGIYLEGIPDGRAFVDAVRRATLRKPVVVLKGGRSDIGSLSAASHTGAVAVPDLIWKSAMLQSGAINATTPDDFLAKVTALEGRVPRLCGNEMALLGNGGGMTVLCADALVDGGLTLADLSEQTKSAIEELKTPAGATLGNPADLPAVALNAAGADVLSALFRLVLSDESVRGAIVHYNLAPLQNYPNPSILASGLSNLIREGKGVGKPIFAALRTTSTSECEELRQTVLMACKEADIPCFGDAVEAASAAAATRQWSEWVRNRQTGELRAAKTYRAPSLTARIDRAFEVATPSHVGEVSPMAASEILRDYGIQCVPTRLTATPQEASNAVREFCGPVVMKLDASGVTHKSDSGGVQLNVTTPEQAHHVFGKLLRVGESLVGAEEIRGVLVQEMVTAPALEILVGMHRDAVLGPTVVVGLGGIFVEALRDVTSRLAPIDEDESRQMLAELKSSVLLGAFRGRPQRDINALIRLVSNFSRLAFDCPQDVAEIDLNPVLVLEDGQGAVAVDWRFLLGSRDL